MNYLGSWIKKEGNWVVNKDLIPSRFGLCSLMIWVGWQEKTGGASSWLSLTSQILVNFRWFETWKKLQKNQCGKGLPWIWFSSADNILVYFHPSKPLSALSHFQNWTWISPVFLPCTHLLIGHHRCCFVTWPWWHTAGRGLDIILQTLRETSNGQAHSPVNNIPPICWIHFQLMFIIAGPRMSIAFHTNSVKWLVPWLAPPNNPRTT